MQGRKNRLFRNCLFAIKRNSALFRSLYPALFILFFLSVFLLCPTALPASQASPSIRIGVLAYKGKDVALRMWEPTGTYLQKKMPGFLFEIIPLTFHEIDNAVRNNEIDFVIANSSIYVALEARHGVTRIATMKNRGFKGSSTVFGGTIFCRAGREDLKTLTDIKGKTFLAVDETSLGGWQAAWREFNAAGIEPYKDFKGLSFSDNHESVVYAVRDGKADAGTVRTDTLERMAEDGKIALNEFQVINRRTGNDFPFLLSTRLYPEWPMARIEKTSEEIARKVAIALLNMPSDSDAAAASKTYGWTIPFDYHSVHDLLKELRLEPYKDYGKVTLAQSLRQYWYVPVLFVLALTIMTIIILHILKLNRHILTAKKEAEDSRNSLEQQVIARTAELHEMNSELLYENDVRRQTEQKLLVAEKEALDQLIFLQSIIDSVPDPVMVISPDYRIKLMNVEAKKDLSDGDTFCYQVSHQADSPCGDKDHPCPIRDVLRTEKPLSAIHTHKGATGRETIVEITASPIFDSTGNVAYVIEICKDITERLRQEAEQKRMDKKLFSQQKEESITTLAGGIAHDFNNILMGVLGYAELLKLRFQLKPEELQPVDSIIAGVERMAELTRQMLAYAKKGKYQIKNVFLSSAIRKALDLSHKGTAMATRTVISFPEDLWPVLADENQIIQAFVNLCNNAFEATEERGGTLTISAENLASRPSWTCSLQHEHPAGDYVSISVSDTGDGIPSAIADKVFEPFVTTKFMGRGLGLPAVSGIVQNHGGCITFSSEAGRGTTFHILLPRSEKPVPAAPVKRTAEAPTAKKCIMVVDDEPDILLLLEAALLRLGYDVIAADTGEKAIESFRSLSDRIVCVILDLQLPGISGKETLSGLKKIKPGIKIIISTGYDQTTAMGEISPVIPDAFIQKPY
ncbi:MAG: PhnD/SsuA/transferrin family substrate-binding protein, partial [Nitrospirota bacterium]|nr:PhnD/SsuA/transferrin family substrate-binding protein [Nitrospirota bacterium]